MADSQIKDLTAKTTPADVDIMELQQDPSGTPADRKITWANIVASIAAHATMTSAFAAKAGPYLKDYARAQRTGGNLTLNSTSWANVDTGLDLTLTAATGDVIEVSLEAVISSAAVDVYFDAVTVVSGSPVNSFAKQGAVEASPGTQGVSSWWCRQSVVFSFGAPTYLTLVSGDISGGNVVIRLRYAGATATNRTLNATTTNPLVVVAKNLGPAT